METVREQNEHLPPSPDGQRLRLDPTYDVIFTCASCGAKFQGPTPLDEHMAAYHPGSAYDEPMYVPAEPVAVYSGVTIAEVGTVPVKRRGGRPRKVRVPE